MVAENKKFVINVIVLLVLLVISVMFLSLTKKEESIPEEENIEWKYQGKWIMGYDRNHNLISGELLDANDSVWERFSYKYDKDGNRIQFQREDVAYQEADREIYYTYENGKMIVKQIGAEIFNMMYEDNGVVLAQSESDSSHLIEYEFDEDGNIVTINYHRTETSAEILYDEEGRIISYKRGISGQNPNCFVYEYDEQGRYSKIYYIEENPSKETNNLMAEFKYKNISNDYTAYTYNALGQLIYKYEYCLNMRGNLVEVRIYNRGVLTDLEWRGVMVRTENNFPGGELPDNFLE